MEKCTEDRRFTHIEQDISEIKERQKIHSNDISELKNSQAETRVYVKQIFDRIDDLKELFIKATNRKDQEGSIIKDNNSAWLKVVLELIKSIGVIGAIIAGMKLLN